MSSPSSLHLSVCVSDLRTQLTDQIKILDSQVDVKQQQLSDLSEFLRRRGDIEAEYARALDKLTERFTHKTKKWARVWCVRAQLCFSFAKWECLGFLFTPGRSSGVSLCARSGLFCWLRLVWRAVNMQHWVIPAATHSHRGWYTAQRIHTVCTSGWVEDSLCEDTCMEKETHQTVQD